VREPHPDVALVSYVRGELDADERGRVEAHLAGCRECQDAASDFDAILERLAATTPPVAEPHWGRYPAEVRARLDARRQRSWARWVRPLPVALAATATAAVVLTVTFAGRIGPNGDSVSFDDAALTAPLDLLDKRAIVERLDLLEDLEVIRNLDRLADAREG
jgi:anti-sigma factor RsiW